MTTHPIIQTLTDKITSELRPVDREAAFDASFNESYSLESLGGPFQYMNVSAAAIFAEHDPIAYRCAVNDYADGEAWVEIDGETYDRREVEELVREFREDLEYELSQLEDELEIEGTADGGPDEERITELQQRIAEKQAEIAAIEKDDFFN